MWNKVINRMKESGIELLPQQSDPYIDVRILYEPGPHAGFAFNRAMETVSGWVLFVDHDVLLRCNPQWYEICQQVIREVGENAGFITCKTNRTGTPMQQISSMKDSDNVKDHVLFARTLWEEFGTAVEKIPETAPPFSGYFLLTNKKVWEDVGGVKDGFYGVDNDFSWKVDKAGYERYIMKGLYIYHLYKMKLQWL